MQEMAQDLRTILREDDRFVVLSDGAFPLYYFRDERWFREIEDLSIVIHHENGLACLSFSETVRREEHILAAVLNTEQQFCQEHIQKTLRYEGADLYITLFHEE